MKTTGGVVLYVYNLELRKSVHFTYNLNLNSNCSHTVLYAECSYNSVIWCSAHKVQKNCIKLHFFAMKTTGVIILYVYHLEIRKSVHFTYNLNLNSTLYHMQNVATIQYFYSITRNELDKVNYSIFSMSGAPNFLCLPPSTQPAVI